MAGDAACETKPDPFQLQEAGTLPYIPATEDTKPWACTLFDPAFGIFSEQDLEELRGANCSVIDGAKPPTLWKMMSHIRSLIGLVRQLMGSDAFQVLDGRGSGRGPGARVDELWQMLTGPTATVPPQSGDVMYHVPLWALTNQVKRADEVEGIEFHCPLTARRDFGLLAEEEGGLRRPYRTHHNLVMHVNECLEILDHEYAATGGLLSLLPTEEGEDEEQLRGARNSLLGQWLLFTQHLVARMHELELNYANALDMLSGEAAVPMQMLSQVGADGHARGRERVYPQDRFVLVNVDEEVVSRIHRQLDAAEAEYDEGEQQFWESGVSGERMWKRDRSGGWYSRGLVSVDLETRFYRVKDQGAHSTLFILPALHCHPAVARTREMETRPTVVSVAAPRWTERVSELEERLRRPLARAKEVEDANAALQRRLAETEATLELVTAELGRTQMQVRYYEGSAEEGSREEVLAALKAYQDKFERLKSTLPSKYRSELQM